MNRVQRLTDGPGNEVSWYFECPGCKIGHSFRTESKGQRPCWEFNGDPANPTFSPSLLVNWKSDEGGHICHSFVRGGQMEFLGDCTHELAGKTVELALVKEDE
jgi:hypothetical protein